MREAVIVSAARTGIGKAFRGSLNKTHGATITAHVIKRAVERAKLDPAEVEDVVIGVGIGRILKVLASGKRQLSRETPWCCRIFCRGFDR